MVDHSELAKALAHTADLAIKAIPGLDDLITKLSGVRNTLAEIHPKLTGIHRAIVQSTPVTALPEPVDPEPFADQSTKQAVQPNFPHS